jgi:hypothetical protein
MNYPSNFNYLKPTWSFNERWTQYHSSASIAAMLFQLAKGLLPNITRKRRPGFKHWVVVDWNFLTIALPAVVWFGTIGSTLF